MRSGAKNVHNNKIPAKGRKQCCHLSDIIPRESIEYEEIRELGIEGAAHNFQYPILKGYLKWKGVRLHDDVTYNWTRIVSSIAPMTGATTNITDMKRWLLKCSLVKGSLPQSLVDLKPPVTDREKAAHALASLENKIYLANPTFGHKQIHREVKRVLGINKKLT